VPAPIPPTIGCNAIPAFRRGASDGSQTFRHGGRAALLARLLYPATRIILTTSRPPAYPAYTPDDDPGAGIFPVLRHPVDPDRLDHCLGDLTA
jgi:hypothetical protein